MVKITFTLILLWLTGCASHQDLLAPDDPGDFEPVNQTWVNKTTQDAK